MCSCLYRILLRKNIKSIHKYCADFTHTLAFRQRNNSFKQLLMLLSYIRTTIYAQCTW